MPFAQPESRCADRREPHAFARAIVRLAAPSWAAADGGSGGVGSCLVYLPITFAGSTALEPPLVTAGPGGAGGAGGGGGGGGGAPAPFHEVAARPWRFRDGSAARS